LDGTEKEVVLFAGGMSNTQQDANDLKNRGHSSGGGRKGSGQRSVAEKRQLC
jgi:hypothetical protein